MCCGRRRKARTSSLMAVDKSVDLALVVSSTPESIYGCITGMHYPFDEDNALYMDTRDTECLSEMEYSVHQL